MRVLVACEFSGIVRDAFIARGHDAVSCDILPTERPGPHIQGDALEAIGDGVGWDLLIAHPPCTYLANSGVRWLYGGKGAVVDPVRWRLMEEAAAFFAALLTSPVQHIAVENPIMHGYGREEIASLSNLAGIDLSGVEVQTVQPWMFGHPERKATQLWLRGLPELTITNDARPQMEGRAKSETDRVHYASPGPDRWKERSRTYTGLAEAMAEQWGSL